MQKRCDPNMTFESFAKLYEKDVKPRLKLNTWLSKESVIQKKILPYFAKRKLSEITPKDIIDWQNEIRLLTDSKGERYSPTYLKTIHNQLSCIFNHAVKYYGLTTNPAAKAGNMDKEERREIIFWTAEEYHKFSEANMDKPLSFYAFEMLYWCGIREGELLALTPNDFDFKAKTVTINKSYQRIHKEDVINLLTRKVVFVGKLYLSAVPRKKTRRLMWRYSFQDLRSRTILYQGYLTGILSYSQIRRFTRL